MLLIWDIYGGEAPYTVRALGHESVSPTQEMRIPCLDVRDSAPSTDSKRHLSLNIPIQVDDALGSTTSADVPIRVLASEPSTTFDHMHVWPGWYDASAIVAPSDWSVGSFGAEGLGGVGTERFGPFVPVAIGRYRAVGTRMWSYFDLSVRPKPSAPSFSYPALMSGLEPLTRYEVQGAWMWGLARHQRSEGARWFAAWKRWLPLEDASWSRSQIFETGGTVCPITEVVGNSITVLHPSTTGNLSGTEPNADACTTRNLGVLTWLTSPDWPGVIWAYGARAPRPSGEQDAHAARKFIAPLRRVAGALRFLPVLPRAVCPTPSCRQPQQSVGVRTDSRPIHLTTPGSRSQRCH